MRRAFTLIELMVVIAIITIIAGVLFPTFFKTRERARCTVCVSNLRQLYAGTSLYMADWNDTYPYAMVDAVHTPRPRGVPLIREIVGPYIRSDEVWRCPSDYGETYWAGPNGWRQRTKPFYTASMDDTSFGYRGVGYTYVLAGRPVGYVKRPSLMSLLFETRPWHESPDPTGNVWDVSYRHNVLFCDGHVDRQTYMLITYGPIYALQP